MHTGPFNNAAGSSLSSIDLLIVKKTLSSILKENKGDDEGDDINKTKIF